MKKNIIYILSIVLAGFVFQGCSLDETPEYTQNSKVIYNDKSSAEAVLLQCYGHLANESLYGQLFHEVTSSNGVYWGRSDGAAIQRLASYDAYPEDDTYLGAVWRSFYKVIVESNFYISDLEKSSLPEDYKKRGVAHAHFLRGYSYFMLANLFGQAMVFTEPISQDKMHSKLQSREDAYKQAEDDLVYASENLNEVEGMSGLAVKNTAIAYLAKLNFIKASQTQSEGKDATDLWKKAKEYGDKVIGKYSLEASYANLWKSHISGSKEVIFQLNYSSKDGVKNRANFLFGPGNGPNAFATSGAPSWGRYRIHKAFYDFHRGTHPNDPRIEVSYLSKWIKPNNKVELYAYPYLKAGQRVFFMDNTKDAGDDPKNPNYDMDAYGAPVKNYWNQKGLADRNLNPYNAKMADINTSSNQDDTKNLILYRYADLLLLMADVENELGNKSKAVSYVNEVLDRARGKATSPAEVSSAIGKEELRDFIFFERMFELVGEPVLFEDVRRRGTSYLKKVIDIQNNSHIVNYRYKVQIDNEIEGQFREYFINNKNITEDFLKKSLLLPIPAAEINYNENVTQENQNFGY